jgi:hydroxyacylglutathione hydrolase
MIFIHIFTFNALQENTYLLFDETKECVIIDPGCYEKEEQNELVDFILRQNLKPTLLLNTHCHVDHVLGNAFVSEKYKLTVQTSKIEEAQLRSVKLYAPMYGFTNYHEVETVKHIEAGEKIIFGTSELEILSVPGHSPGHLAFWNKTQGFCIAGDVLFRGSIGRYDLPGGDFIILEKSIKEVMYTLPNETIIYPGHGPKTDIGFERKNNPYVRG